MPPSLSYSILFASKTNRTMSLIQVKIHFVQMQLAFFWPLRKTLGAENSNRIEDE
ncbi:unnamed protein product [Trichogramma brassicae]|uniref:Uncharacterized protein n=1 Tax=Trichogramma brassicae TaxID=86971 RepID=A0A6H5I2G6_9HYME|nr:unnamed protein product [Trichogramma brassicae]